MPQKFMTMGDGDMPVMIAVADGPPKGENQLLQFFFQPGTRVEANDTLDALGKVHPDGLAFKSIRSHLWTDEKFSHGVIGVRPAGFMDKYHEEVMKSHGNVFFCRSGYC